MAAVDAMTADVDLTVRTEEEWAKIYHIVLANEDVDVSGMDEFEWAWRLQRRKYRLDFDADGSCDTAEAMETRAMKIARELLMTADVYERRILRGEGRYIETKYVLAYRTGH